MTLLGAQPWNSPCALPVTTHSASKGYVYCTYLTWSVAECSVTGRHRHLSLVWEAERQHTPSRRLLQPGTATHTLLVTPSCCCAPHWTSSQHSLQTSTHLALPVSWLAYTLFVSRVDIHWCIHLQLPAAVVISRLPDVTITLIFCIKYILLFFLHSFHSP